MSSDKQLNYVNNLQNRDQNLYYVDDVSELNNINLEENDKIYAINNNKLFQMEIVDQEEELSGSIVSFNGRNNTKIKSLVVDIEPKQSGSGDPSPNNIRPISGWTGAEISRSGEDISAVQTISITFPSSAGTVYGGTLTINPDKTGILVVDKVIRTVGPRGTNSNLYFSTEPISAYPSTYVYSNFAAGELVLPKNANEVTDIICTHLPSISRNYAASTDEHIGVFQYHSESSNSVRFAFPRTEEFSSLANLNAWLQSQIDARTQLAICVPLKETTTYTLTESEISGVLETLYGTNNIWADTGDITVKIAEKGKTAFELKPYT